jgi:predicted short-subunit dehydrogenase-like oxidoreductase (DUF2520 family)
VTRVRIVGAGRAGTSLARALATAGWDVAPFVRRGDDPTRAADGVDLLVLATPDDVLAEVARSVRPVEDTLVVHLAGSRGLDVLAPHPRRGAVHPLVALPTPEIGSERLVGAWFAVAGDPGAGDIVTALGGRPVPVADADRMLYHATAVVASNHLVALMGQVERLAAAVGVPVDAYLDLAADTLANVRDLGAAAALTGPAARGDEATIRRHLEALPPAERPAYEALSTEARRLAASRGAPG